MKNFMKAIRRAPPTLLGGLMLLVGLVHAGTVTYVYTDPQGTPLAEADASGNITATFDYAPYGSQALGAPPSGPGYTGHVNDPESGLVYMQARYYDPAVGRFLSADPISPAPGNLFNFNRYDYTNNNPINHTDPAGRCIDGVTCGTMLSEHVAWRMSHPGAPADGMEKAAMVGTGVMAAPAVGLTGIAVLRSPLTYLAFSYATKDLGVVDAMKAAQERQTAAELVEAAKTDAQSIEEIVKKVFGNAGNKEATTPTRSTTVAPTLSPKASPKASFKASPAALSSPSKPPELPPPPKLRVTASVAWPHSHNEVFILSDDFRHGG